MNPTQSDTPTPRTDALPPEFNILSFARQLERELQRATQLHADLKLAYEQNAHQCVELNRDLARVTAERDDWRRAGEILEADKDKEIADLRARVAELEHQLKSEIDARNGWWDNCKQAEQRNAKLEAALRDLLKCPTVTDVATCPNGDASRIDEAPEWQAVLQISCAWTRYKKIKALARSESPACQNATNGGQISSESATPAKESPAYVVPPEQLLPAYRGDMPAKHPDTEREWQTGTPDVPAGAMRRLWCAVLADNGKVCHSMLCYANGHAMPLADWVDTIPDCCKPIDGDEDNVAWYGWYEESCDHCETQWHSSANVIAWMELPKYAARKQGGSHD